jgi:hypothetical protein
MLNSLRQFVGRRVEAAHAGRHAGGMHACTTKQNRDCHQAMLPATPAGDMSSVGLGSPAALHTR